MADPQPRRARTGKLLHESVLGFDLVELTTHALDQMAIREVSEQDVLRTLRRPTKTGLPTQPKRERVRWNKTARVAIDVVYELPGDRVAVITVIKKTRRIVERG